MELKGATAIVTGSGSGIGRAIAMEFARQGIQVVCAARRMNKISETVSLIQGEGGCALGLQVDITDARQVKSMVDCCLKKYGAIDILYNNAGSFNAIGGLWEIDPDIWWHDVTVNLYGTMLCCKMVLPHMMKWNRGIIINMDGGGSTGPLTGGSAYGSSKAAVLRLTDTLAAELGREGSDVFVFSLGPGLVQTEMTMLQAESPNGQKWIPSTKEVLDKGQARSPEDCAKAAVKLIQIARPELNGRVFSVTTDFEHVLNQLKKIKKDDLLTLRFRRLD